MKKIYIVLGYLIVSMPLFGQKSPADSLVHYSFSLQIDLPGLLATESRTFSSNANQNSVYAPTINISAGYLPRRYSGHEFKKSILVNFTQYNSLLYINLFKKITTYTATYNHVKHYSASGGLKVFYDKNLKGKGFFAMVGAGYSEQKIFGDQSKLYEYKTGWNVLANAGYRIAKDRFYFEFNLGVNNFFAAKAENYKLNQGNLTEEQYYDWMQQNYPNPSLESVKFKDQNTVKLKYKNSGLTNTELLPFAGVNFGFCF